MEETARRGLLVPMPGAALQASAQCGESPRYSVSVAFIVPTLKRPEFLRCCLHAIQFQTVAPAAVLLGVRADDGESCAVAKEFHCRLPIRVVEARGVGVIGSMSSCLAEAQEKYIALLDDDVELPPHWLETMVRHLESCLDVLAVAGRDLLQDHPELRRTEKQVLDVGRVHWYGRITGNHHRGGGEPRKVDILRGSNMLLRGSFLREVGFEQRLRGQGAQVNWELALAFHAMQRGKRFYYDPRIEIIHHTAPRFDADNLHRGGYNASAVFDCAFNESLVVALHARGLQRISVLCYQVCIGSPLVPGVARFLIQFLRCEPHAVERFLMSLRGRIKAVNDWGAFGDGNL